MDNLTGDEVEPEEEINEKLDVFFNTFVTKDEEKLSSTTASNFEFQEYEDDKKSFTKEEWIEFITSSELWESEVEKSKFTDRVINITNDSAAVNGYWEQEVHYYEFFVEEKHHLQVKLIKEDSEWYVSGIIALE